MRMILREYLANRNSEKRPFYAYLAHFFMFAGERIADNRFKSLKNLFFTKLHEELLKFLVVAALAVLANLLR